MPSKYMVKDNWKLFCVYKFVYAGFRVSLLTFKTRRNLGLVSSRCGLWDHHWGQNKRRRTLQSPVTIPQGTVRWDAPYFFSFLKWRIKGATSQLSYLEKFSLNFASSFAIRVNLLHPYPSLSILVPLWFIIFFSVFFIIVKYYFQVFLNLKVILYMAKLP